MTAPTAHLPAPALDFRAGTPVSTAFDDVYFSQRGGVAETEHVFLAGNDLPARWAALGTGARFTIGELGFGTGLNFLVAWKRFLETASPGAVLHYWAVEQYPFHRTDLARVLALEPEVATEAAALLAAYPLRLPGIHRIHLPRAVLTLCYGDVAAMLDELGGAAIDAWFLDGFSPAKNPDMWSSAVMQQLAQHTAPGASFASFTAAGSVRRALADAGFTVEKVPGFAHKRDMIRGQRSAGGAHVRTRPGSAIILGAGIAGASAARALAERGVAVTVIERARVAGGASGNAAGVLFPPLPRQWNRAAQWYFTAYGFALRQLTRWRATGLNFAWESPGMLRLPRDAEEAAQLACLNKTLGLDEDIVHWLDPQHASAQAGVELPGSAAFFPQGSWVCPRDLCASLLRHAAITLHENSAAKIITRVGDGWAVTLENGDTFTADSCCVASAAQSRDLLADYGLRLGEVGGQVSDIAAANGAPMLRSILCQKGYIIPQADRYLIGATYHREAMTHVTDERHAENLANCATLLPGLVHGVVLGGRSSVRATTPDRLPYVGALADGLFISAGHGSRGLLSAPLAAEIIASALCGEPPPVVAALAHALRPLRFMQA